MFCVMIDVVTAIEDLEDVVKTKVLNDGEVSLLNLRHYVYRINKRERLCVSPALTIQVH